MVLRVRPLEGGFEGSYFGRPRDGNAQQLANTPAQLRRPRRVDNAVDTHNLDSTHHRRGRADRVESMDSRDGKVEKNTAGFPMGNPLATPRLITTAGFAMALASTWSEPDRRPADERPLSP